MQRNTRVIVDKTAGKFFDLFLFGIGKVTTINAKNKREARKQAEQMYPRFKREEMVLAPTNCTVSKKSWQEHFAQECSN